MSEERPKCLDLMDAVREVRWWIGVNLVRFDFDVADLTALLQACIDFENRNRMVEHEHDIGAD